MADYNANIRVNADTSAAERAIKRLSTEVEKLQGLSKGVSGVRNIGEAFLPQRNLRQLEGALKTIADRANTVEKAFARTVEGIGTLAASGAALEGLNAVLKNAAAYTGNVAANFSGAAREAGSFARNAGGLEGTLARINDGLVEVAHQIQRAVVPGFSILDDAAQSSASGVNAAQAALQRLLDNTEGLRNFVESFGSIESAAGPATAALAALAGVMEGQLSSALYDIEQGSSSALKQLGQDAAAGVSELQRLIRAGQGTVEQYERLLQIGRERLAAQRADSVEARKAANTITRAQQLLNDELERQNDLLREARGLRSQSVENRATNTYNTTQRRKTFLAQQTDDAEALQQALQRLEQTSAERLNEELDFRYKILSTTKDTRTEVERIIRASKMPSDFMLAGPRALPSTQMLNAEDRGIKRLSTAENLYNDELAESVARLREVDRLEESRARRAAKLQGIRDYYQGESGSSMANAGYGVQGAAVPPSGTRRRQIATGDSGFGGMSRAENIALGVGFPLLFGGGIGTVTGSLLGSFAGSGFGGQILGGAIGQIADQFAQAAAKTGQALRDPITNFQQLADAGYLASKSQEYYVKKLIEVGQVSQATAVVQAELVRKIGASGLNDLNRLGAVSTELTKAWAELNLQLQAALAGPLANLLKWITDIVQASNQGRRSDAQIEDIRRGLSGRALQEFNRRDEELQKQWIRGNITKDESRRQRFAMAQQFAAQSRPQTITGTSLSPEAIEQARKASEATADSIRDAYRQGFQLQRQAADISRAAADYRRKIESDIFAKNQEAARQEIDNARRVAQLRIESTDLALRKQFSGSQGLTEELLSGVRAYVAARRTGEADIEQKRRQLELNLADINKATGDYIYEQVKSRVQFERQIEDYKMSVADYQLKVARQIQSENKVSAAGNVEYMGPGGAPTTVGPRTGKLRDLARSVGFNDRESAIMAAIAMAESGGRATAHNPNASTGDNSYGLWQINMLGGMGPERRRAFGINRNEQLFDPLTNAKAARQVYKSQGFGAWSVYRSGAYKQYLSQNPNFAGGQVGIAPQLQTAASQVPRPTFGTLNMNSGGMTAAVERLQAAKREELSLEQKLQKLNVDKAAFDLQEIARGKAQTEVLMQQRTLEQNKLTLLERSGSLSQVERDVQAKRLDDEAQINAIFQAREQALLAINEAVKKDPTLSGIAQDAIREINTGLAQRLDNTVRQIELEQELLRIQQEQQYLQERANLQSELGVTGTGQRAGFIGNASRTYEAAMKQYGDPARAQELAQLTQQIDLARLSTEAWESSIMGIGGAFAQAMTTGVASVVSGTESAKQIFAQFLQEVARALLKTAAQMIATYIAIGMAKAFAGLSGGGANAAPQLNFADMAKYSAPLPGFAEGGLVTRPTLAMVGEGNQPEYIIPANKMDAAMARYSAGARGSGVIPKGPSGSPGASSSGGVVVNYSGPTLNFNGDDYLPKSAVPELINAAAKRGAEMGQSRTIRTLQNSRSTRNRIGMS